MSGHRPAKKMPRLRGAAAQAHKAKVAREQSEEPAAEQPAPKAATPRKSHVKATGKGKKRVEPPAEASEEEEVEKAEVMASEEEEEGEEGAAEHAKQKAAKVKKLAKEPRKGSEPMFWCLKDRPGPTCLLTTTSSSADDLLAQVQKLGTFCWDGVRDEASNAFVRKMRPGDTCCLFHGGAADRAIVAQLQVVSEPKPDQSAFDSESPAYDAASTPDKPTWYCVDVKLHKAMDKFVTQNELLAHSGELPGHADMLTQPRLCVFPAPKKEWDLIFNNIKARGHHVPATPHGAAA